MTRRYPKARGFASGSHTVCVADLPPQDSPYQNPVASLTAIGNSRMAIPESQEWRCRFWSRRLRQFLASPPNGKGALCESAFTLIIGCEFSRLAGSAQRVRSVQHLRWPTDPSRVLPFGCGFGLHSKFGIAHKIRPDRTAHIRLRRPRPQLPASSAGRRRHARVYGCGRYGHPAFLPP